MHLLVEILVAVGAGLLAAMIGILAAKCTVEPRKPTRRRPF